VLDEVLNRYKATLVLHGERALALHPRGIVLGVTSACAPTRSRPASAVTSLFGASMPVFWLGIVLMVIFSLWLGWLPPPACGALRGGDLRDLLQTP